MQAHNLLFDLDGTLSDPSQGIQTCFNQVLLSLGREPLDSDKITSFIGPPLEECFSVALGTENFHEINQAVLSFRDCYGNGGLYKNILYPGIIDLLHACKAQGDKLYVVTSKKEEFARRILQHFQIDIFFTDVIGAISGQPGHKTALISEIMARHTLPSASTIMIGDRSHDIIGAQENNIASYGVLWGFGTSKELTDAGATAIFTRITALGDALRNISHQNP